MYKIYFNKQSRKALLKAPQDVSEAMRKKLNEIALDSFKQRSDVEPLKGRPGYRLKLGKWRAIYKIEKAELKILVIKIATRGDVYK